LFRQSDRWSSGGNHMAEAGSDAEKPVQQTSVFCTPPSCPIDNGDAGKDWTDGLQKSDVCCTTLFGINYRPANCVFLTAGERVQ
jgi:hypothetical protein